ncbi:MAG: hypothetical protein R2707_07030 [Acidimicrobiales bacterium]
MLDVVVEFAVVVVDVGAALVLELATTSVGPDSEPSSFSAQMAPTMRTALAATAANHGVRDEVVFSD